MASFLSLNRNARNRYKLNNNNNNNNSGVNSDNINNRNRWDSTINWIQSMKRTTPSSPSSFTNKAATLHFQHSSDSTLLSAARRPDNSNVASSTLPANHNGGGMMSNNSGQKSPIVVVNSKDNNNQGNNNYSGTESLDRRAWAGRNAARIMPTYDESDLGPSLTTVENTQTTPQRLASFLAKPFRYNPLKRTKSVSKLDRSSGGLKPAGVGNTLDPDGPIRACFHDGTMASSSNGYLQTNNGTIQSCQSSIRGARSHESLLNYSTTSHMIDLGSNETSLAKVHPSVLGSQNCIQIQTKAGATKYYSCKNSAERDRWVENIRSTMYPNIDGVQRVENSLQLWILELKGVNSKRRFFVEMTFDQILYARTSAKLKTDICFWGEHFEFNHLPKVETICLNIYREADKKKKKDRSTLIGYLEIPVQSLTARHPIEKWYPIQGSSEAGKSSLLTSTNSSSGGGGSSNSSSSSGGSSASIRVKGKYTSVSVLPLAAYSTLLHSLQTNYLSLSLALEPALSVRAKEDFATSVVRVLQKRGLAIQYLTDLLMAEVEALDNEHLMFRGNSLATKAMEAYMKLVGDHYLHDTLGEFVKTVLESDDDCEVDPLRLSSLSVLDKHQKLLTFYVEAAWGKVINSFTAFPIELRQVFASLRQRLTEMGRPELGDNVISSSIFLRYLCPAILSPSLFNLVSEYPSGRGARNLTLIAKTVQNLANFTKFGGKEHYMEFMNAFVEKEWKNMKLYLQRISGMNPNNGRNELTYEGSNIDVGKELSLLHSYLVESWSSLSQKSQSELKSLEKTLSFLTQAQENPEILLSPTARSQQPQQSSQHPHQQSSQHPQSRRSIATMNNAGAEFDSKVKNGKQGMGRSNQYNLSDINLSSKQPTNNSDTSSSSPPPVPAPRHYNQTQKNSSLVKGQPQKPSNFSSVPHQQDSSDECGTLDDRINLQHVGYKVQERRNRPRYNRNNAVSAKDAILGRNEGLSYVDDPSSAQSSINRQGRLPTSVTADSHNVNKTVQTTTVSVDQTEVMDTTSTSSGSAQSPPPPSRKKHSEGSVLSIAGPSSGYNSLNQSGGSSSGSSTSSSSSSSSSSPVERTSVAGPLNNTHSQQQQQSIPSQNGVQQSASQLSAGIGGSVKHHRVVHRPAVLNGVIKRNNLDRHNNQPQQQQQQTLVQRNGHYNHHQHALSISNPLYSLQSANPVVNASNDINSSNSNNNDNNPFNHQRSMWQSLPDIQAATKMDRLSIRDPHLLMGTNSAVTPDSSFDDAIAMSRASPPTANQSFSYAINGIGSSQHEHRAISPSYSTPMSSLPSPAAASLSANNQSAQLVMTTSTTTASSNNSSALPRTNPRYNTRSPKVSHYSSTVSGNQGVGRKVTAGGGTGVHVPPCIRRTKTENGIATSAINSNYTNNNNNNNNNSNNNLSYSNNGNNVDGIEDMNPNGMLTSPTSSSPYYDQLNSTEWMTSNRDFETDHSNQAFVKQSSHPSIVGRPKMVETEELNEAASKQAIIDAQQRKIDSLMMTNNRLISTLSQFKDQLKSSPATEGYFLEPQTPQPSSVVIRNIPEDSNNVQRYQHQQQQYPYQQPSSSNHHQEIFFGTDTLDDGHHQQSNQVHRTSKERSPASRASMASVLSSASKTSTTDQHPPYYYQHVNPLSSSKPQPHPKHQQQQQQLQPHQHHFPLQNSHSSAAVLHHQQQQQHSATTTGTANNRRHHKSNNNGTVRLSYQQQQQQHDHRRQQQPVRLQTGNV